MAYAEPGTSGDDVLLLQKKLNKLLGSGTVKETGEFDKRTMDVLKSVQTTLGLMPTGEAGDATLKAIDKGIAKPGWYVISHGRVVYQLSKAEYKIAQEKARARAAREMGKLVSIAREAQLLWQAHGRTREDHVLGKVIEKYAGATYPQAGLVNGAVSHAEGLVKKAKAGQPITMPGDAQPIVNSIRAVSDYRSKMFKGGDDLIKKLEMVRDGCVLVLEVGTAIATAGTSTALQVGVATGMGAYKGVLSGLDKGGASISGSTIAKEVYQGAVVDGAVSLVMKNKATGFEKFSENMAKKAAEKYAKSGTGAALKGYAIKAMEGGLNSAVEEVYKADATLLLTDKKITKAELEKKGIEAFVKGALLANVGAAAEKYYKANAGKNFRGEEFFAKHVHKKAPKGYDPAAAYAAGLKGVVDKQTTVAVNTVLAELTPAKAPKVEAEIRQCTIDDRRVAAWVKAYDKKQK
ncbi:MAG: peptidoglycan-binding domain-containing protein [Pseudomonadota bacterium]